MEVAAQDGPPCCTSGPLCYLLLGDQRVAEIGGGQRRCMARLKATDGWAESCALECVLHARPRAGHGALTACHPTGAKERVCHEDITTVARSASPSLGQGSSFILVSVG